jgi:hypothetical protein
VHLLVFLKKFVHTVLIDWDSGLSFTADAFCISLNKSAKECSLIKQAKCLAVQECRPYCQRRTSSKWLRQELGTGWTDERWSEFLSAVVTPRSYSVSASCTVASHSESESSHVTNDNQTVRLGVETLPGHMARFLSFCVLNDVLSWGDLCGEYAGLCLIISQCPCRLYIFTYRISLFNLRTDYCGVMA